MIIIVLDIVLGTSSCTLTFVHLIGAVCAHVTLNIKLVDAYRASFVTRVTESLIISDCPLCTLTLEGIGSWGVRVDWKGIGGVCKEQIMGVAEVTVVSIWVVTAIPAGLMAIMALKSCIACVDILLEIFTNWKTTIWTCRGCQRLHEITHLAFLITSLFAFRWVSYWQNCIGMSRTVWTSIDPSFPDYSWKVFSNN